MRGARATVPVDSPAIRAWMLCDRLCVAGSIECARIVTHPSGRTSRDGGTELQLLPAALAESVERVRTSGRATTVE